MKKIIISLIIFFGTFLSSYADYSPTPNQNFYDKLDVVSNGVGNFVPGWQVFLTNQGLLFSSVTNNLGYIMSYNSNYIDYNAYTLYYSSPVLSSYFNSFYNSSGLYGYNKEILYLKSNYQNFDPDYYFYYDSLYSPPTSSQLSQVLTCTNSNGTGGTLSVVSGSPTCVTPTVSTPTDFYKISSLAKSSLGGASKDISDSLMQGVSDLLKSFTAIIVVLFLIGVIFYFIKKR